MKKYGVLGEKLEHSYSPQIHNLLADYDYRRYEVAKDDVERFLGTTELAGMNVTMPYKKRVMNSCVWLSDLAKRMGAVNTLVKETDGWHGYNTDYYGFCELVRVSGIDVNAKKALVLGSGGASNTICHALEDLGASRVIVISRNGENNYDNLEQHKDAGIIVNTTPMGMYPNNGEAAVDLKNFPECEGVLDVVYNPIRTALLLQAEKLNIKHADGFYMLVAQAKQSAEFFTNTKIDDAVIADINKKLSAKMQNIVLIGMPGAGKSSIGRKIAEITGRRLIEADDEIIKKAGTDIPTIFKEQGEAGFRAIETEVLSEVGKLSGCVISTGGGCVTRSENYPLLHQNGHIVWIKRDIKLLPTDGRPVSQANPLEKLYEERKDKYAAFADDIVVNDKSVKDAAEEAVNICR